MKIQVLSDLHIEFEAFNVNTDNADLVVLAGDIHVDNRGVLWALENIKDKPVLYVLGNHEFYDKVLRLPQRLWLPPWPRQLPARLPPWRQSAQALVLPMWTSVAVSRAKGASS